MDSGTSSNPSAAHRMSPFRVIAAGTTWRWFGSQRAAETLLKAASGNDEQNRMLAGISLVKAGQRSFDLIEDKVEAGQASPSLVQLLTDIDSVRARDLLQKIATGEPGEVAETARECIELLDRMDAVEDDEN